MIPVRCEGACVAAGWTFDAACMESDPCLVLSSGAVERKAGDSVVGVRSDLRGLDTGCMLADCAGGGSGLTFSNDVTLLAVSDGMRCSLLAVVVEAVLSFSTSLSSASRALLRRKS